jgi:hypothetical protein
MIVRDKNGNIKIINLDEFYSEKEKYMYLWKKKYNKEFIKNNENYNEKMTNYLDGKNNFLST